jgi:hypothetical protein
VGGLAAERVGQRHGVQRDVAADRDLGGQGQRAVARCRVEDYGRLDGVVAVDAG